MGDWDDTSPLIQRELMLYLEAASRTDPDLPTRCAPWTVRDVTVHLGVTFERFADMLEQGRTGDMTPPFASDELDAENLRAVAAFGGDADIHLADQAERFLGMVGDPDEIMPHQRGPIPVGLQLLFGLADLAIHHDDIAVAAGARYQPGKDVVDALDAGYSRLGAWEAGERNADDVWGSIVGNRD